MRVTLCIIALLFVAVHGEKSEPLDIGELLNVASDKRNIIESIKNNISALESDVKVIQSDLARGAELIRNVLVTSAEEIKIFGKGAYGGYVPDADQDIISECTGKFDNQLNKLSSDIRKICCVDLEKHSKTVLNELSELNQKLDMIKRDLSEKNVREYLDDCHETVINCKITDIDVDEPLRDFSSIKSSLDKEATDAVYNLSHDDIYSQELKDTRVSVLSEILICIRNKISK